jgi:hypothetical protein
MTITTVTPEVKVGDFFVSSWGYDQTNVDFYRVVGITPSGKSVKVQQWTMGVDHSDVHDYVVASEEGGPVMQRVRKPGVSEEEYWAMDYWDRQEATEEVPVPVVTKRLQSYGEGANKRYYFSVNSYSSASLWDGRPMYQTGHGYGH